MMCAFMTPVLKDNWEVYNTKRSRNNSESSQKSLPNNRSQPNDLRRRVLAGSRSMSAHYVGGSPRPNGEFAFAKTAPRAYHLSTRNSRNASRASFSTVNSECTSPTKTTEKSMSHRRSSTASITKFHNKVMDKLRNVLHLKEKDDDSKVSEDGSTDDEVKSNP